MLLFFRPLQELPCLSENLDGSLLCTSQSKAKKRQCVYGDVLHAENTPNELIQHWSPPRKQPRSCTKGKENAFVLGRRPRRSRDTAGRCHLSTYHRGGFYNSDIWFKENQSVTDWMSLKHVLSDLFGAFVFKIFLLIYLYSWEALDPSATLCILTKGKSGCSCFVSGALCWDTLPDELLLGIFSRLSLQDLLRTSRVCKRWHRLA